MFQLTENIPVKEGGDAILSCNFGKNENVYYDVIYVIKICNLRLCKEFRWTDAFGGKMVASSTCIQKSMISLERKQLEIALSG